jgi:hypothetical protein
MKTEMITLLIMVMVGLIAGLLRCGKSCRLRWTNYLRPDLKRGLLSESEEQMVIDLHAQLGNRFLFFLNLFPALPSSLLPFILCPGSWVLL